MVLVRSAATCPHMRRRMATGLQPAGGRCGAWWWTRTAYESPLTGSSLWFGSINLWDMQDAPQLWRDGAAYYRSELISLLEGGAGRLFATKLLDALVDGSRFGGR